MKQEKKYLKIRLGKLKELSREYGLEKKKISDKKTICLGELLIFKGGSRNKDWVKKIESKINNYETLI